MSIESKGVRRHLLSDVIEKIRHAYVDLGFREVYNPIFIEEEDIYKQWNNEAPTILDRCFYLATLPRPDVGIDQDKLNLLKKKGVVLEPKKKTVLQKVFHNYKKGLFDGDELITKLAETLSIDEDKALIIMSTFPEVKRKRPIATNLTLRSHMTSGWFLTLKEFQDKEALPIKLFSVDLCFRREQALDATHLRCYHSASSIVMDRQVDPEYVKQVVKGLLKPFGIETVKYVRKKRSASYYEKDSETEVFVRVKGRKDWVEVADFGIYSNKVLKRYKITYQVLNLGLGAERLAMAIYGFSDVRKLVYPQFYVQLELSDQEIASSVTIDKVPRTEEGKRIQHAIIEGCERYGDMLSPYEYNVYDGKMLGKRITVKLVQNEKGKRLLGRAAFNEVVAYDGNILGIPRKDEAISNRELIKAAREKGVSTGIRYIDSLAAVVANDIEEAVKLGKKGFVMKRAMTSTAGELNIKVREDVLRFITSKNKRIDLRGPVFMMVVTQIE
ncbi:MAG: O-phosphoserine--tRNA ligase [Candidatus Methylarchaceae archaeon HK01B]|nr:O-phosphoserine--tRNA ligase [Candidatus Methylarchaceae archaeon HK01B]